VSTARDILGALAAIAVFFGAIAMTGPSDIEAMVDAAKAHDDAITEARLAAMSLTDNERLAWRVCRGLHAERARVYQISESGEYVCRRAGPSL
jgi:hypothetical protein